MENNQYDNKIPLMRAKNTLLPVLSVIFFILGIILIFIGFYVKGYNNDIDKYRVQGKAIIERIETVLRHGEFEHHVYVTYSVEDETYNNIKLDYYNSWMKVGDEVTIHYDVRNPGKVIKSALTLKILYIALLVVGPGLLLTCPILIVVRKKLSKKRQKNIARLKQEGFGFRVPISFFIEKHNKCRLVCSFENVEYRSEYVYFEQELNRGPCFVNIYFDKEEFASKRGGGLAVRNSYIDIDSVERGSFLQPEQGLY